MGRGWRASVGVEDALQSSLRDTERSSGAEGLPEGGGGVKDEGLAERTKHRAGKGMAGMGRGSGGLNAKT